MSLRDPRDLMTNRQEEYVQVSCGTHPEPEFKFMHALDEMITTIGVTDDQAQRVLQFHLDRLLAKLLAKLQEKK